MKGLRRGICLTPVRQSTPWTLAPSSQWIRRIGPGSTIGPWTLESPPALPTAPAILGDPRRCRFDACDHAVHAGPWIIRPGGFAMASSGSPRLMLGAETFPRLIHGDSLGIAGHGVCTSSGSDGLCVKSGTSRAVDSRVREGLNNSCRRTPGKRQSLENGHTRARRQRPSTARIARECVLPDQWAHYATWRRSSRFRIMNRFASADATTSRWRFLCSPR